MKRLALVASFCGITITQMMAQNINGEQISDTTLFDKFSKELGEVVVKKLIFLNIRRPTKDCLPTWQELCLARWVRQTMY